MDVGTTADGDQHPTTGVYSDITVSNEHLLKNETTPSSIEHSTQQVVTENILTTRTQLYQTAITKSEVEGDNSFSPLATGSSSSVPITGLPVSTQLSESPRITQLATKVPSVNTSTSRTTHHHTTQAQTHPCHTCTSDKDVTSTPEGEVTTVGKSLIITHSQTQSTERLTDLTSSLKTTGVAVPEVTPTTAGSVAKSTQADIPKTTTSVHKVIDTNTSVEAQVTTVESDETTTQPKVTHVQSKVTTVQPQKSTVQTKVSTVQLEETTTQPQRTTVEPKVTTTQPEVITTQTKVTTVQLQSTTAQSSSTKPHKPSTSGGPSTTSVTTASRTSKPFTEGESTLTAEPTTQETNSTMIAPIGSSLGLSAGAIVGVIIAVLLLVAVIVVVLFIVYRRFQQKKPVLRKRYKNKDSYYQMENSASMRDSTASSLYNNVHDSNTELCLQPPYQYDKYLDTNINGSVDSLSNTTLKYNGNAGLSRPPSLCAHEEALLFTSNPTNNNTLLRKARANGTLQREDSGNNNDKKRNSDCDLDNIKVDAFPALKPANSDLSLVTGGRESQISLDLMAEIMRGMNQKHSDDNHGDHSDEDVKHPISDTTSSKSSLSEHESISLEKKKVDSISDASDIENAEPGLTSTPFKVTTPPSNNIPAQNDTHNVTTESAISQDAQDTLSNGSILSNGTATSSSPEPKNKPRKDSITLVDELSASTASFVFDTGC